jgi:hypothetical protein
LPFQDGYRRMVAAAERDGTTRVAVVPGGFHYARGAKWTIVARIGEPQFGGDATAIEQAVRDLSAETKTARLE